MGIAEYELYYQAEESTSVSAFQHEINQFTASVEGGVCFRCIVGSKMGYASTQALHEDEAAAIVERAAANASVLEADEPVFLGEGGKTYQAVDTKAYPLPTTEELIAKVLSTQEAIYQANPAVIDGSSTQGISERSSIAIVNSKGLDLSTEVALSGLVVAAVVVALFCGMRFSFSGPMATEDLNDAMGKATDFAEGIKEEAFSSNEDVQ